MISTTAGIQNCTSLRILCKRECMLIPLMEAEDSSDSFPGLRISGSAFHEGDNPVRVRQVWNEQVRIPCLKVLH